MHTHAGARHQLRWIGHESQRDAAVARQQEVQDAAAAIRILDDHFEIALYHDVRSWRGGRLRVVRAEVHFVTAGLGREKKHHNDKHRQSLPHADLS